ERDHIMREIRELVAKQALSSKVPDTVDGGVPQSAGESHKDKSGFGIEIVDVRIVKADLPPENSEAVFKRMQAERKREATTYRAQGDEEAQRIRADAERQRTIILA